MEKRGIHIHAWDVIPSVTLVTCHRILAPVYSFTAHTAGILWYSGTRIRRNISRQQYQEIEKSGAWFGMCRMILRGKYGTCSANTTLQGLEVCKLGLGRASRGKVRGTFKCYVGLTEMEWGVSNFLRKHNARTTNCIHL